MKKLRYSDWVIEIEADKTREFCSKIEKSDECQCNSCRNYRLHCETMDGALKEFFHELGIDPSREGEFMEFGPNADGEIHYAGFYHITGKILEGPTKIRERWNQIPLHRIGSFEFGFSDEDLACVHKGFPEPIVELHFEAYIPWRLKEEYKL